MGIRKEEESFPRGNSFTKKPALRKTNDSLFKRYKTPKKKTKKNTFLEEIQDKSDAKKLKFSIEDDKQVIKPLTYQSLEQGMVVMGRIREISQYHMFVCLPGRLSAKVSVAAISTPYTENLKKLQNLELTSKECPPLTDLFRVGQAVLCSILEVKREGELMSVSVSLEPSLVNSERSHYTLRTGQTIQAAVCSEEDYGYTLHTGVVGLTTFLSRNNAKRYVETVNGGRPLVVGEVLRCLVMKCTMGKSSSQVEVTLDPLALARATLTNVSSQTLQPGFTVHCVVEQVMKSGLVVKVGRNKAYIETSQLEECWSRPNDYKTESELKATVLYICPHSDFQLSANPMYLTLKNMNTCVTPRIALGAVIDSQVTNSYSKGIFLCLGENIDKDIGNKGFVSIRRLGDNITKANIKKQFPKGKKVTARILAFDYMEQIYNCSFERSTLQQQCVSFEELKVGDRVTCRVTLVEDDCLKLALGSITLHVFREHSADVPHSNLYQHFYIGDVVDGRVLKVDPELRQATVTLKETLIRSPALMDYRAARINAGYWGTVRHVRANSLLVTFFNDVAGTLQLDGEKTTFTPGQLVKCYITYVNVKEEKLLMSLTPRQSKKPKHLTVGEVYELVISEVFPDHFAVTACDYDGVEGIVPKCHQYGQIYSEGDFMKAWLYQIKAGSCYFSPNPAIRGFLKDHVNIKPGYRLQCCVAKVSSKKMTVSTPLSQFPTVDIPKTKWVEHKHPELNQIVHVYVELFDAVNKSLILSWKRPKKNIQIENSHSSEQKNNGEKSTKSSNGIPSGVEQNGNSLLLSQISKRKRKQEIDENFNETGESKTKKKMVKKQVEDKGDSNENSLTDVSQQFSTEENEDLSSNTKKNNSKRNDAVKRPSLIESERDLLLKTKKERSKRDNVAKQHSIKEKDEDLSPTKTKNDLSKNKTTILKRQEKNINKHQHDNKKDSKRVKLNGKGPMKRTLSETGFLWDVKPEDLVKPEEKDEEDIDEDEEEADQGKKKKTVAERRKAAKEKEAQLREVERKLMGSEDNPQTVDQYERAVLTRPDDADLWIRYISYHLQATEIEKARAVARQALQTIGVSLAAERLKVWTALLSLENLFGTQESLKSSLDEALRNNDEFSVYSKMLKIFSDSNKPLETEQLVQRMLRKLKGSPECWLLCCSALMKCGLADKARNLLHRAIAALPAREHVNLLCKFALLENQYGFGEQAQTLFEHILTSYPKRTDVWSVYVDMLVKSDKIEVARQVLERASRQKLSARNMKTLFNKWINFEVKHGSPDKEEHVRKLAEAYVSDIIEKLE
ncbi:protein RRP5 homolog isoform X3 [Homalodisca vitripennis]|uniref:protein RRP5 homolog isoform X1 n=2 Tax=Homalodisca vitripennis TaxID=197043 RepID=UPI001EEA174E|nr:protein RRP5 homolog isoform X1 [Homalodisca vitripennis]XP_046676984.1 protein RRP5 homolog isoform X2 [Homalodisca vitripennis]XP_046676985.1 protein RRP5 homolog isoform X3 [Homalodisca vitripennis]